MPDTVQDLIRAAATKHGVPPELAMAVAEQESGFNPTVTGPEIEVNGQKTRAIGTFQLLPSTAATLGVNAENPRENIDGGVRYLRQLLDRHQGDLNAVLREYGGVVRDTSYVPGVLARVPRFRAGGGRTTTPPPLPAAATQGMLPQSRIETPLASQAGPPPAPRSLIADLASGFDPRTRTGRRNIAGAVGSIAANAAIGAGTGTPAGPPGMVTGAVAGGIRGAAIAAAGAAAGGALAETGEQAVELVTQGAPPRPMDVATAAGEQGLYETVGGVVSWPFKAAGRRIAAMPVAKNAASYLQALRENLGGQLDSALTAAEGYVQTVKKRTETALSGVEQRLGSIRPAVSNAQAGRMAHRAIEGPAKTARDYLGQQVEEAAASGPPVDISALKAEAQGILERELKPAASAFPHGAAKEGAEGGFALSPEQIANARSAAAASGRQGMAAELEQAMAAVKAAQEDTVVRHPAMGVLTRILEADDIVPFGSAHQFKRELDDAIGTQWDAAVKKRVTSITQHMRNTLRSSLSGHEPYNQATSAYAAVAPLFTKGLAPRLKKVAVENPEALISLVKGTEPTKAAMLRDLLVTQASAGGGGVEGQAAWDALRSAWTYERLIKGGAAKLSDRIGKLDPEFVDVMYGDASGRTVLGNLRQIGQAWKTLTERGAQELEQAKAGVETAKGVVSGFKKPTPTEKAFKASTVIKTPSMEQEASDVIRAVALGPGSIWGALSTVRLLKGPALNDLMQWAAYSPKRTQMFVEAVTGPAPGMALADLFRTADLADLAEGIWTDPSASGPPPAPSRATGAGPRAEAGPPRPQSLSR